jgi:hypothetical protein
MENTTTDTAAFPDAIQDETIEQPAATEPRDTYEELVEHELSEEDKAARRIELESIDREIIRLEEQKKSDNKVVNGEIKVQKARKDSILQALDSGTEKRLTQVYEKVVEDNAGNIVRIEVRSVDDDRLVDDRAATESELREHAASKQGDLFGSRDSEPAPEYVSDPADEDGSDEDLEPDPAFIAQGAEDEGRVVRTTSKEVRRKTRRSQTEENSEA